MKRARLVVATGLLACGVLACGGSLPQPRFTQHGADETPVDVPTPPPPGKVEIVPKRPPELKHPVWIDGEWEWTGRRWVWKDHGWQEEPPGEAYAPPLTMRRPPPEGTLVHLPGTWKKDTPASP
jgi:hypothetical protein